ncbi:Signal transduction response regulator [Minicystis rosea]|nr:Signal transduction response regulator [Minicystis rosea]
MPSPTNLTALPTSFIGRAEVLHALEESLDRARLVTVLGPPGTGKTRLAKQHARALLAGEARGARGYAAGIFFCDLSDATSLEGLVTRIAPLVGVDLADSLPLDEAKRRVEAALRACGPMLLILDNFEQIVRAAAHVLPDFVAAASDGTRFLVTSRERLGVPGETLFDLGPLTLPEEGGPLSSEAVELFVERARAVSHTFQPSARGLADIGKLVRLLDGLPLAIELAAARTRVLAPAELIDRLHRRFALLTHDPSTLRARRATLWETIEASWSLLSAWEQAALAQVSTFRGGFGVTAAEQVIDLQRFPGAPAALDILASLRDKSLLLVEERETSARRFTLLASIREFGEAQLDAAETQAVHARHARHYLTLGEALGARIETRDEPEIRRQLRLEHDNFMAVHQRFLAGEGAPIDLRGASLRAALVLARSASAYPYAFCLDVLDAALAASNERDVGRALLARALEARGNLRRFVGQTHESVEDFEHVRALAAAEGDRALVASALSGLGNAATVRARWSDARALFEEALSIHVETKNRREEGRVLAMLAATRFNEDEPEGARALLTRALDLQRASGDRAFEGTSITSLGIVTLSLGALAEARTHLAEGLRIHREVGARHWEGVTLSYAALVEQEAGRIEASAKLHEQAIALLHEINVRRAEGLAIAGHASLLLGEGRLAEAKDRYRRALDLCRAMSPDHEGLVLACLGAIAALEGDITTAEDTFACAEIALASYTRPSFAAALDVHRGQLDLARARAANDGDRPALHASARARIERAARAASISTDVRFARRLLEASLAAVVTEAPLDDKRALVVGPSGLWFKPPRAKESVRLHRRRSLQRIVHELAEHRVRAPGEAIRIAQMIACGWPGERILPEAGTERVYTAVATLRKLGLRKLLLQRDDGYLLDPAVDLVRSRSAT